MIREAVLEIESLQRRLADSRDQAGIRIRRQQEMIKEIHRVLESARKAIG